MIAIHPCKCVDSHGAAHVHGCYADEVHVQVVGCVVLIRAGLQLGTVVQAAARPCHESQCLGEVAAVPHTEQCAWTAVPADSTETECLSCAGTR